MIKAIGIYREIKLAGKPGSDQRILNLTAEELKKRDFEVLNKTPEDFLKGESLDFNFIFTMARGREINDFLIEKEKQGIFIINSPESIRLSLNRKITYQKMQEIGGNVPETKIAKVDELRFSNLEGKVILKPSGRHEFWFVIENEKDFEKAISEYKNNEIKEIIVQKFIEGEHVKYYMIGEELILSQIVKDKFSKEVIDETKRQSILASKATGLQIFGGDFIIKENIPFCVDANDWPSMSSIDGFTQEEAAIKIANLIEKKYNQFSSNNIRVVAN